MNLLIAALTLGLIFAILALGVYISFKIFNKLFFQFNRAIIIKNILYFYFTLSQFILKHNVKKNDTCKNMIVG